MRIMWRAWALTATVAASLVLTNGVLPAAEQPVVHVKAVVKDGSVRLEAQASGPFEYTTYRPSASLFVLDLSGVSAADPAGARVVSSDLVKSYRELTYDSGKKPVVRLEILLSEGVEPRLERNGADDLTVLVSRTADPAAAPALKPAAVKSPELARPSTGVESIQQVSLAQADGKTQVAVIGSGRLTYHASRLVNPDRLVLDFAGSHLKTSTKQIASNLDPVREIRLAQFSPEVSRIVIDLRNPSTYDISAAANTVTIAFAPKGPASGAVNSDPVDQPSPLITTKQVVPAPVPAPAQTAAQAPAEIPTPAATLPVFMTKSSASLATPAPQQEATAATQLASQAVAASNNSTMAAPASAQPVGMAAAPAARAAYPQSPAATPAASNRYSGEPISVNLKDVDLRDFFRLIHEISGLNVVMDPSVKGTLTIVLDDVPWDQALDIVLHNNDLDKQLDGNVLRIATKDTIKKEAEETRDLAKAQSEAADVVTTTRVLNYAKSDEMATTLKKFLSSRGDILADSRSNTIIIRDVPSTLPVIDNLLRQLDRRSQQVEIEARVVAANRSFSRELGSQLALAFGSHTASGLQNNTLGGNPGLGGSPITHTPAPPLINGTGGSGGTTPLSGAMPLLTNLGVGAPTSGFSYIFQSTNFALDYLISAAEERGVGKLLSEPKETVQNNQKAVIKQGTKIPVQTIVNNTVSVQFVDAVLELDVTPQITGDGTIFMDVTVENDQIDASIPRVQGIPAIDTQSTASRVTVKDGETMLLGGIIVTTQRTDIQQVPLIGSLPVIGNLFKHTTVSSTSQELLFFITPRILPD
jgi:type IV pilus assembly protein PilQ